MTNAEQRKAPRIPVKFKVDWKSEGHFLFENATNISEHGIFIETHQPMKEGTLIELGFTLPEADEEIHALGEVAWVNPAAQKGGTINPGMGIRFVNLRDVDKETILSLIKRIAVL